MPAAVSSTSSCCPRATALRVMLICRPAAFRPIPPRQALRYPPLLVPQWLVCIPCDRLSRSLPSLSFSPCPSLLVTLCPHPVLMIALTLLTIPHTLPHTVHTPLFTPPIPFIKSTNLPTDSLSLLTCACALTYSTPQQGGDHSYEGDSEDDDSSQVHRT